MEIKSKLSQIRTTDLEIETKLDQLHHLKALAEKCTSVWSDMTGNTSRYLTDTADIIIKIIALEDDINSKIDLLVDQKTDLVKSIDMLTDSNHRIILSKKYLEGKTFEQIAVEMNYSWRHLLRIHKEALRALQDVTQ